MPLESSGDILILGFVNHTLSSLRYVGLNPFLRGLRDIIDLEDHSLVTGVDHKIFFPAELLSCPLSLANYSCRFHAGVRDKVWSTLPLLIA